MFILTAYSQKKGFITLTKNHSRQKLEDWRRSDNFFCPQCNSKLMLKVGQVVIPHFAHLSRNDCAQAFSEGESADHLAGKQQLYEFLQGAFTVKMEAAIDSIGQRPDLLVDSRYAIEYQCSPIPKDVFDSRNAGYRLAGIQPIWILRTPPSIQNLTDGLHVISLSKFHQLFIPRRPIAGQTLLTYNNYSETFYYASHLLPVQQNQFIAKIRRLPILRQQFPFLSVNPLSKKELIYYRKVYLKKREQFLISRVLRSRKGINDLFLRRCYLFQIRPEQLPNWIGIPTAGSEIFKGHATEWQAMLVFHIIEHGREEASLNAFIATQPNYDQHQAREAVDLYLRILDEAGLSPQFSESLQQSVPVEILFESIFSHYLAKRYEN